MFRFTESSSGPRVLDPYTEYTTHCGIPNAYKKQKKITKFLQTYTQNMKYLLLFHNDSGCWEAPQIYVTNYVYYPPSSTIYNVIKVLTPNNDYAVNAISH